jgi:hypothetical protein
MIVTIPLGRLDRVMEGMSKQYDPAGRSQLSGLQDTAEGWGDLRYRQDGSNPLQREVFSEHEFRECAQSVSQDSVPASCGICHWKMEIPGSMRGIGHLQFQ